MPRFGVSLGISSDMRPHFITEVINGVCATLGTEGYIHTLWHPQSCRKVERMNQTLRSQISKICQKSSLKWPQALPLALLRIRVQSQKGIRIKSCEFLYCRPYKVLVFSGNESSIGEADLHSYLIS